jgi:hypothetical protein
LLTLLLFRVLSHLNYLENNHLCILHDGHLHNHQ